MDEKFVDPRYAKSGEYGKVISEIEKTGKCPFCEDEFKYHKNPILDEDSGWISTECSWPYPNAKWHFMILNLKEHKTKITQLTDHDLLIIFRLIMRLISKFGIDGGAIAMRFGEPKFTGATVLHLHIHLIVPILNQETDKAEVVNFPIG
jgi:diadenosine tetraphosphate (Ap4A) HIT family hydrolase